MLKSPLFLLFSLLTLSSKAVVIIDNTTINAMPPGGVLISDVESNTYDFDVNNDGQVDWSIRAAISIFASGGVNALAAPTSGFIYQTLQPGDQPRVYPLDAETLIGDSLEDPTYSWYNGFTPSLSSFQQDLTFGPFLLEEGYLGFRFEAEGNTHYGYAFLESTSTTSMTISEVAWETEPGKAIRAGNIPEPTSTLLLSLSLSLAITGRKRS